MASLASSGSPGQDTIEVSKPLDVSRGVGLEEEEEEGEVAEASQELSARLSRGQ